MPLSIRLFTLFVIYVFCTQMIAGGELKIALVIGNGDYKYNSTLANPVNDANDMTKALQGAGFEVTMVANATKGSMEGAIRKFGLDLKNPDAIGLFYYSGHGVQSEGQNYLIPVDADIRDQDELSYLAVDAELVLSKMRSSGNKLNLVFLDACRNNPYPGSTRSATRGLSIIRTRVPESVIVYATDPGAVAMDGKGKNSPFTQALLANITIPQDISQLLKKVTAQVQKETQGHQTPWVSTNLTKDFSFVSPTTSSVVAPSFGPVSQSLGSLRVSLVEEGNVYILGKSTIVPAGGTLPVNGLLSGPLKVTVHYSDGKQEEKTISIEPGLTSETFFSYRPVRAASDSIQKGSLVMVRIPKGHFRPGMATNDHVISMSEFWMASTEITQSQWQEVMGTNPSFVKGPTLPVTHVSWFDSIQFCNKLSLKEGLSPAYSISGQNVTLDRSKNGYRLPSEVEWEYAATGAGKDVNYNYSGSDDASEVAWHAGNSGQNLKPVGTKNPNSLSLFDLSGNVSEWCWDWYSAEWPKTDLDSLNSSNGSFRIHRGGNLASFAPDVSIGKRFSLAPTAKRSDLGLRVVRN